MLTCGTGHMTKVTWQGHKQDAWFTTDVNNQAPQAQAPGSILSQVILGGQDIGPEFIELPCRVLPSAKGKAKFLPFSLDVQI